MTYKTVLIVEDHEDIRKVIRMRLERLSYRIIEAGNGNKLCNLYDPIFHMSCY